MFAGRWESWVWEWLGLGELAMDDSAKGAHRISLKVRCG